MSLSRAFTTRKAKAAEPAPHRSNTTKIPNMPGGIRNKISGPVALVHTTNMLSYNAPDIVRRGVVPPPPMPPSPPTTSGSSTAGGSNHMPLMGEALTPTKSTESDSDALYLHSAESTPPTSPDISAAEDSRRKPEPNHLSCYFQSPGGSNNTSTAARETNAQQTGAAPTIPQRAPSHTKRSHEVVAHRQRTSSRASANSNMSHSTKLSTTSFNFSRPASNTTAITSPTASVSQHSTKPSVSSITSSQHNQFRHTNASTISSTSTQSASHQAPPLPAPFTSAPIVISVPHPGLLGSHKKAPSRTDSLTQKPAQAQPPPQVAHPFGKELAKVSEIAEEYAAMERAVSGTHSRGGSNHSTQHATTGKAPMEVSRFDDDSDDEETREMRGKGLFKFAPEVYIDEIQNLISAMFSDLLPAAAAPPAKVSNGPSAVWI